MTVTYSVYLTYSPHVGSLSVTDSNHMPASIEHVHYEQVMFLRHTPTHTQSRTDRQTDGRISPNVRHVDRQVQFDIRSRSRVPRGNSQQTYSNMADIARIDLKLPP